MSHGVCKSKKMQTLSNYTIGPPVQDEDSTIYVEIILASSIKNETYALHRNVFDKIVTYDTK